MHVGAILKHAGWCSRVAVFLDLGLLRLLLAMGAVVVSFCSFSVSYFLSLSCSDDWDASAPTSRSPILARYLLLW